MNKALLAPNFALPNFDGKLIQLEAFRGQKNIVLVFLRGFM